MIPQFPIFKKLELKDKKDIEDIATNFPPYSDFNFVSLWCYNIKDSIEISILHNNLVIKFLDYTSHNHIYSFLGTKKLQKTIEILLEYARSQDLEINLKLIPASNVENNGELFEVFSIKEDKDNFDYIISLKNMSNLIGDRYGGKRRLVKKFNEENPNIKIDCIDIKNSFIKEEIMNTFFIWEQTKKKERAETIHELEAIKRVLASAEFFNLVTIGVFNNINQLIGFTITEVLSNNYAIGHFMKVNTLYRGLSETLHKFTAEQLLLRGCSLINIEQDLGIENMRNSKKLWYPEFYLKKYIISKKSEYSIVSSQYGM